MKRVGGGVVGREKKRNMVGGGGKGTDRGVRDREGGERETDIQTDRQTKTDIQRKRVCLFGWFLNVFVNY